MIRKTATVASLGLMVALGVVGCNNEPADTGEVPPNTSTTPMDGAMDNSAMGNETMGNEAMGNEMMGNEAMGNATAMGVEKAMADLKPTQGSSVIGAVSFTKVDNGVKVMATVNGLKPGKHGFHVHEKGDCSAPDATSAGGHFNPTDMPHAGPDADKRHEGDLGNITADADGTATLEVVDPMLSLEGPNSIVGKAVIVHAGEDDLTSQPSGDAGDREACGVVAAG